MPPLASQLAAFGRYGEQKRDCHEGAATTEELTHTFCYVCRARHVYRQPFRTDRPRGTSVAALNLPAGVAKCPPHRTGGNVTKQVVFVLVALLVGLVAGGAAVASQASIAVQGQVSATEQEADEGYFAIGGDTMIVAKPQSALHQWLRTHNSRQVRVTIELDQRTQ
jgi:hypothetical protein